uniref:C2H2-type domain-containing protein n=1 Tax=Leishmania guyanensis TaxID=5670 RepID=A0A1E1IYS9_LEIGU|nr:hypothetical protein, conserved [Leishmania guyanensis]
MSVPGGSRNRSVVEAARGFTVHLVCPHCAKEFTGNSSTSGVRSNYRRHLLIHTGERPFPCSYCHQRFTTKPNLRRHVRLVHPSLATPSTEVRCTADIIFAEGAAAATPLPLPEMHLPHATATNVGEPTFTSSTAAVADPAAFTCEDCELEISNRSKLRRHKRYYCPFRENIFADPVKDAVDLYRTQQRQHRQRYSSDDSDEGGSDEEDACSDDGDPVLSVDGRLRRRNRSIRVSLALTEAEKNYLAHVAERSGLKFVEDAYASDESADDSPGSGIFSDTSSSSISSRSPYRMTIASLAPRHPRSPGRVGSTLPSMKRTPLHGPLPSPSSSPNQLVLRSPKTAASASSVALSSMPPLIHQTSSSDRLLSTGSATRISEKTTAEDTKDDEEDDMIGAWTPEDLLHLHHHRRRSGHRRERHILQKRLRAQEGALMALTTDSPHRQPRKPCVARSGTVERDSNTILGEAEVAYLHVTPSADNAHSSTATATTAYAYLGPSQSLVTPQVLAQAESLLVANWRRPRHGRNGAASAFACPYCADYTTFTTQRGLQAHAIRVHNEEVAKSRTRVAVTEAAQVEEGCARESEESEAAP